MGDVIPMVERLPIWCFVRVRCNWCASNYHGFVCAEVNPYRLTCGKCGAQLARVVETFHPDPMTMPECQRYVDELVGDYSGKGTHEETGSGGCDRPSA